MKKIITVLLLTLLLAFMGTVAYAETAEKQIAELAMSNEKVVKAECVIYRRNCVIAVQTEKFSTRSEYERYRGELVQNVKARFELDNVYVTRNPKAMAQIEQLAALSEEERNEKIEELIKQYLGKCKPPFDKVVLPKPIP